jgi:hypothetical protein
MAFPCAGETRVTNLAIKTLEIPFPVDASAWAAVPPAVGAALDALAAQAERDADSQTRAPCEGTECFKGGFKAFNPVVTNVATEMKFVGRVKTLMLIFSLQCDWQAMVICVQKHPGLRDTPLSKISWKEFEEKFPKEPAPPKADG